MNSKKKKKSIKFKKKYAVYIDENVTNHHDNLLLGYNNPASDDNYFPSLNKFFDFLEKKFNLEIIIALYPKLSKDHKNNFLNRKCILNSTCDLIMNSEFVLSHASTSNSYAVLSKKPILTIITDEIYSWYGSLVIQFSKILNTQLVNIDKNYDNLKVEHINKKNYKI